MRREARPHHGPLLLLTITWRRSTRRRAALRRPVIPRHRLRTTVRATLRRPRPTLPLSLTALQRSTARNRMPARHEIERATEDRISGTPASDAASDGVSL